ncbi:YhdH/YhfP family quinone oxidoreductase [Geomonas sp. RF6]|uniref:YhdH/YhfP family quinone oxidoreductase n=1 Tax=Geomonas sp. RF6 TaxID=2897342 RepID=UPI001E2F0349|nr:YhdH/YhfP family quinone oxidoreductase [Geomonas sp. RF6]UFS72014.1 YhdH/YhfP family quinone oxidoreductase [Geomonas sp. RF6]
MESQTFRALVAEESAPGQFTRHLRSRRTDELPEGALLVRVQFSSLNYKDALSAMGRPGVTKRYPHTPGIDAAGEVVSCADGAFNPGDQVIVTGYDLGMNTPGGFGQFIRVPSSWGVKLPKGLTAKQSMILGTAGLTAGLSLHRLLASGMTPRRGEMVVTGATGGVGSIAVELLSRAGFEVVAVTGKQSETGFLRHLGAKEVVGRTEILEGAQRPLMTERWGGAVDVVGGEILSAVIRSTRYGGVVTCCGLAGSAELPLNVYPFILRGITLAGIDSAQCPAKLREEVWQKLAGPWKPHEILESASSCTLESLEEKFPAILDGKLRGRTVVQLPG